MKTTFEDCLPRILGKKTLDSGEDWTDVTDTPDLDAAGWHFFKAGVEMR